MAPQKFRNRLIDVQFLDFSADMGTNEPSELFFNEETINRLAKHHENLKSRFNKSIGVMVVIDIFIALLVFNPFFELKIFAHEIKNTPGLLELTTIASTMLYAGGVFSFMSSQSYDGMIFHILLKKYPNSQIDKIKSIYVENDFIYSLLHTELKYAKSGVLKKITSQLTTLLILLTSTSFFAFHFLASFFGARYIISSSQTPFEIAVPLVSFIALANVATLLYFIVGFLIKFQSEFVENTPHN